MKYFSYKFRRKDFDYLTRGGDTAHPKSKGGILQLLQSITPLELQAEIRSDFEEIWNKIQKSKGLA